MPAGFPTWKADSEHGEVPLQPGVDGEGTGCGVHAGNVLSLVDLFQCQFGSIIPKKRRI